MARTPMGPHRAAVTRMLRATGLLHIPEEAPLVVTLKTLAARLDADPDDARARSHWLTALAQLRQVMNTVPAARPSVPPRGAAEQQAEEEDPTPETVPNDLTSFKQRRGIA